MIRALLVLLAVVASAQSPMHELLGHASVIVRGTLIDASADDRGDTVLVTGKLRVSDVVRGAPPPPAVVPVRFSYAPRWGDGPSRTTKVPQASGLWLLRPVDGGYEALQSRLTAGFEAHFIPLPDTLPVRESASPDGKLASMITGALAEIVRLEGTKLTPQRSPGGERLTAAASLFRHLTDALMALNAPDVVTDLSSSPEPELRIIGLAARISRGDANAILEVERDLARFERTVEGGRVARALMQSPPRSNDALESLARLAVSELTLPGLEFAAATRVGSAGSAQFAPWYAVMLESPDLQIRTAGLSGLCMMMRRSSGPPPPDVLAHCPDSLPVQNRAREQVLVQFWKSWWESHRGELPRITAPARYAKGDPDAGRPEVTQVMRFRAFVNVATIPRPGPARTHVAEKISATDEAALLAIVTEVKSIFDTAMNRERQHMQERRMQNLPPDREFMMKAAAERDRATAAGLERTRRELSSGGWRAVEEAMDEIHIRTFPAPAPPSR